MTHQEKNLILNQLSKEINTLKSKEGYLYAGLPLFKGLFGRDSLISSWALLKYNPLIAKATLLSLAKLQGTKKKSKTKEEPGKIVHEFYPDYIENSWFKKHKGSIKWLKKGTPFYFSVDSTPLFLIVLTKYYKQTKDKKFLKKIWPNAKNALALILSSIKKNKFLVYEKIKSDKGLSSQSWKDGVGNPLQKIGGLVAVPEAQGYTFLALNEMAKLVKELKDKKTKIGLNESATKLKKDFNREFLMKEKKFFYLAINDKGEQITSTSSNPGHLLFTKILNRKESDMVVSRLFSEDMWTPYGIRTHSIKEKDFDPTSYQRGAVWPHENWIIAQGLKELNYKKEYSLIKQATIKAYKELGFIPELYGVSLKNRLIDGKELVREPCYPQAWSTSALFDFLKS